MKPSHISNILQTLESDQINQMDDEMRNLVRAVEKTGKPGVFTLKLKIIKTSANQSLVTVDTQAKLPKGLAPIKSLYFAFDDLNQPTGELSVQATKQPDLFDADLPKLRTVKS